jgi:hypothetical protein
MLLRNFLFLDTATMEDYLATLEGYVIEGTIDQTEVEKKDKSGKAGYKIVEGGIASEKSTETKQKLAVPDGAKFQQLYEALEGQHLLQFLDAFDEEIWNELRRGELLEVDAIIRFPKPFMLTQAIEDFSPLLDIMAAFGEDSPAHSKDRAAFEGMSAIAKLVEGKPVPILFEAASTPDFTFVANLPRRYLRCQLSDLEGEATVVGKVQRILTKGRKVEVFSLFPAFTSSLPNLSKEQRRQMQREMVKKELAEAVKGPAIILAPLAIYR